MTTTGSGPASALLSLLEQVVDYAGLFPPASLPMRDAVHQYGAHRAGAEAWMLGRFVVPVGRLEEFEDAAEALLPRHPPSAWRLSVLAGTDLADTVRRVGEFNLRHREPGAGRVLADALELKAGTVEEIERARAAVPSWLVPYVELPYADDPAVLIAAVGGAGMRAKARTGGVTADAFPEPLALARFIRRCMVQGVRFKLTAGLHHALRGEYRLTYEPGAPHGTMYGFLNVVLATVIARLGGREPEVVAMLEERDPSAIKVDGFAIRWRHFDLRADDIFHVRERLVIAFGSCSFLEPVDDLRTLGLL